MKRTELAGTQWTWQYACCGQPVAAGAKAGKVQWVDSAGVSLQLDQSEDKAHGRGLAAQKAQGVMEQSPGQASSVHLMSCWLVGLTVALSAQQQQGQHTVCPSPSPRPFPETHLLSFCR